MRYLTLFKDYLRGIHDYPDWIYIFDLLMRIDSYNDYIEEFVIRENAVKSSIVALPVVTRFLSGFPCSYYYRRLGWFESKVRALKNELKLKYGIRVDAFRDNFEEPEDIIDGQISIEDYVFSLNPLFRISRPDLIKVHP